MADQALTGLRILDLSQDIAGPYATKLFADYGAEVTKVEPPAGDRTRRAGPFPGDDPHIERSGLFLHLNTNKLGLTLDVFNPTGQRIVRDLARDVDAVVESFPTGTVDGLGLSYNDLARVNPDLVMLSITPFGQYGPHRDYAWSDLTLWAMGSRMSLTGHEGRPPHALGGQATRYLSGTQAALGLMGALTGRSLNGLAQSVDVSMQETLVSAVDSRVLFYEYTKQVTTRGDTPPAGFQYCADGLVQFPLNLMLPRQWRRMVQLLEMPELLEDSRFLTPADRGAHRDDLEAIILPWLLERSKFEIAEKAQALGVFAAPVMDVADVVNNEHFVHRGYFVEVEHPAAGRVKQTGAPFKMKETPWAVNRPAPLLGQHNVEIYCDRLGYSREEIARLQGIGVI